tara:strand:- start:676 stop:1182 length:507 start_codon:yes stop_codon:yes gene_type:complete
MRYNNFNNKLNIVVIRSQFNSDIVSNLYLGVEKCFEDRKIQINPIEQIEVPGAFELPYMTQQVLNKNFKDEHSNILVNPDCIITLGCVIKGETAHFEYISNACANTLSQLTINNCGVPIMFGVITAYTREQALKRSEVNFDNQENLNIGYNVTNAAIETLLSLEKHSL